jgi:hypothetical protein
MKKINIKITEGCVDMGAKKMPNAHNQEEARMHRTTLAHLIADVKVLLSLIEDGDDLPEWLETKITKAGDYMSSAARYISGNEAREQGQLEEEVNMSIPRDRAEQEIADRLDQIKTNLSAMDDDELQGWINRLSPGEV